MEHTSPSLASSVIEDDVEETCGCRLPYTCGRKQNTFLAKRLQRFAKPHWALGLFSAVGFLQGFIVSGLVNIVLTTIEKRFGLNSASAGLILSSYNIASCVVIPVISYMGGRGNKPVWIGWGIALLGLGCLLFASPHLFVQPYNPVTQLNKNELLCSALNNTTNYEVPNLSYYKYVFQFAHILNGIGTAALLTLGMTYLDENVEQKVSSLYHGVYFAVAAAIGPAAGYVLGGFSLKLFTVIGERPNGITPEDTAWVGAWWLGFVICGVLLIVLSVPIMMFPPSMPGTRNLHTNRSGEMHQDNLAKIADKDENFGKRLNDLPKFILVLLRNSAFLLVAFANALDFGLIAGLSAFTPKYLESTFSLTPTSAAFYLGIAVILGGSLGYIFGGLIVSKAELTVNGMMRLCCVSTVAALGCSFIYFYSCPNIAFAGATVSYDFFTEKDSMTELVASREIDAKMLSTTNFTSQCNDHCSCNTNSYKPICGSDGITYFSPCYAGCTDYVNNTFANCNCIANNHSSTAAAGMCPNSECNGLAGFMFAIFGLLFFTVLCWTPVLQIVVRVVPFKQRSFAVGAQWVFNRAFGGIPVPIVFGKVYDLACAVWSGANEDDQGSCRLYFNHEMSRYTLYLVLTHKTVTLICYILGAILYKPTKEAKVTSRRIRPSTSDEEYATIDSSNSAFLTVFCKSCMKLNDKFDDTDKVDQS